MAELRLLLDPVNEKRRACCKPVGDDGRGPSLLIDRTLGSGSFTGPKPAKSLTLFLETVSSAVGE